MQKRTLTLSTCGTSLLTNLAEGRRELETLIRLAGERLRGATAAEQGRLSAEMCACIFVTGDGAYRHDGRHTPINGHPGADWLPF